MKMNESTNMSKDQWNQKTLFMGIIVVIGVILIGQLLDTFNVFGDGLTTEIMVSTLLPAGVILGYTMVSAKTRMSIKELLY